MPDAGRSNLGVNGRGPDVNFFPRKSYSRTL